MIEDLLILSNTCIVFQQLAGWPNGKALDYESRDCRFDPCVGHPFFVWSFSCLHIAAAIFPR
ncbi:hypothetical protein F9C07_1491698 [Aspergillus flavus]|uniref:Uncharacterized protein n=1 Tax=Aspergillus flavus (strain ATCC 200026 / FGSC A1120 / IAM 13836 / NRRL 3357 / JCM 12722 / SRRC 167) TaxID=332952 RepID=A0A7U2MTD3_ASPFN|nr:hypothetical protein F9C07_1491698 [Aspergillus flavus]